MDDGVVVLPIFASFIVTKDKKEYLHQRMMVEYDNKLGRWPTIH
jgi:ferritin